MTALIQIADDRTILLVQLSGMNRELDLRSCKQSSVLCVLPPGFPSELKVSTTSRLMPSTAKEAPQRVVESPDILKLGVGVGGESGPRPGFPLLFDGYR